MFYNRKWIWNPFINWWLICFRISLSRALPPGQSSMFWLISNYLHLRRYYVLIFRIWYQKLESHANEEHRARINQWHNQWSLVRRISFLPSSHIASASCEPWPRSQTSSYSRRELENQSFSLLNNPRLNLRCDCSPQTTVSLHLPEGKIGLGEPVCASQSRNAVLLLPSLL